MCAACGARFTAGFRAYRCPGCQKSANGARLAERRVARMAADPAWKAKVNGYQRDRYHLKIKTDPRRNELHRANARRTRQAVTDWLYAYKIERGCIDCGWDEHHAGLELDHMGPKNESIVRARTSISRLVAEIEAGDCVVRCSRCHGVKSWAEKNRHSKPTGACRDGDDCERLPRTHPNQKRDET